MVLSNNKALRQISNLNLRTCVLSVEHQKHVFQMFDHLACVCVFFSGPVMMKS